MINSHSVISAASSCTVTFHQKVSTVFYIEKKIPQLTLGHFVLYNLCSKLPPKDGEKLLGSQSSFLDKKMFRYEASPEMLMSSIIYSSSLAHTFLRFGS